MYSGYNTASINCRKKIHCNDSNIREFEMIDTKTLQLNVNVWIDYIMVFGLEKEDGSFNSNPTPGS